MDSHYQPHPIETADTNIPNELKLLAEQIARNVHEVWAKGRIDEGWTYGVKRDDQRKKHPCLIPYEELTESEKEYDRRTSQETIKAILKLGFTISKATSKEKE